ncbi:MAG: tyrosine-type recombinase/integrase [Anaerolineae bacterium]
MDQATEAPSKIYLVVTGVGKTNDHDYYFTHATAELWYLWKQVRKDKLLYAISGWRRGEKHRPMFTNGVSQMLYQRGRAAGAESPFRSHPLRHAKVKRSRKKVGLDIAKVLVDHADIETTWGYANIDQEELEEAVLSTGISFDIWEKSVVANVF